MQSENGSDTINFETLTSQMIVFFKEKSQGASEQPKSEEAYRAVENHLKSKTSKKVKKYQMKTDKVRKNRLNWSIDQELEYFYAAIKFSIDNPYLTTSWQSRKPDGFYKFMEAHMVQEFGKDKGAALLCKPKDQNFKKIHFDEAQQPKDLLELSLQMLIGFIEDTNYQFKQQAVKCEKKLRQVSRYDAILKQYHSALKETKKIKDYEQQLKRLRNYSKQMTPMIMKIHGSRQMTMKIHGSRQMTMKIHGSL